MNEKGGRSCLPVTRGAYWPIFHKENRQVALVRPLQLQIRPERDVSASHVPCLMSPSMLAPLCLKAGCKFNLEPCHVNKEDMQRLLPFGHGVYPVEYEIEVIVDHKVLKGATMYFIKWKDWDSEFNTWEPRENLEHSPKLLEAYEKQLGEINRMKRKYGENYLAVADRKNKMIRIIQEASRWNDLATLFRLSGRSLLDFQYTKAELKNLTNELLNAVNDAGKAKPKKSFVTNIQELLSSEDSFKEFEEFAKKRIDVLSNLRQWELQINSLPFVNAAVKVENHVDLEGCPQNFTYITDYQAANGIVISEDPPIGCECASGCYDNRKSCCPAMSSSHFAYNRNGTLTIPRGTPIYECNKRCSCGDDCPNRVVQKRPTIPLAIFRTDNGRGWGIRTLERIKKGTFVLEYVGEVITSEEAENRGRIYDNEGSTYLFDLDFDGHNEYTVDAARCGNVAHFMNHSCEPNLVVYVVWINNLDPKLPRIAFFSNQDIRKGEELTFDYSMSANTGQGEPTSPSHKLNASSRLGGPGPKYEDCSTPPNKLPRLEQEGYSVDTLNTSSMKKRVQCKCGSKQCRMYLY